MLWDQKEKPMGFYATYLLPHLIERACGAPQIKAQRQRLIPQALGRVAEIGLGTGHNLPFYDAQKVDHLIGVDPAGAMLGRARKRAAGLSFPIEIMALDGENLPFDAASLDSIVVTYSLCTIPDPARAIREMRRVLKPDGRLYFAEHGRAPDDAVSRWQQRLDHWLWPNIAGGCHLSRRPDLLLSAAGFEFDWIDRGYLAGIPRILGYHFCGVARL